MSKTIRVENHTLTTRDQVLLSATLYRPDTPNDHAVIIGGAMGVRQSFYRHYASYLAEQGFVALTFDFRGMGQSRSRGLWGYEAHLWQWGAHDLQSAINWITRQFPAHTLSLVGHSLGGQILGLAANANRVTQLVGISAQSAYWGHWSMAMKIPMAFMWYGFVPISTALAGYFPASIIGMGDNVPKHVALDWARGGRHKGYLIDLYGGGEHDHYSDFAGQMLLHSFSDDGLAPMPAVDALPAMYPNVQSVRHDHIQPHDVGLQSIGHMGFFKERSRGDLWDRITQWMLNPSDSAKHY